MKKKEYGKIGIMMILLVVVVGMSGCVNQSSDSNVPIKINVDSSPQILPSSSLQFRLNNGDIQCKYDIEIRNDGILVSNNDHFTYVAKSASGIMSLDFLSKDGSCKCSMTSIIPDTANSCSDLSFLLKVKDMETFEYNHIESVPIATVESLSTAHCSCKWTLLLN